MSRMRMRCTAWKEWVRWLQEQAMLSLTVLLVAVPWSCACASDMPARHSRGMAQLATPDPAMQAAAQTAWDSFTAARAEYLERLMADLVACARTPLSSRDARCDLAHDSFALAYAFMTIYRLTGNDDARALAQRVARHVSTPDLADNFFLYRAGWYLAYLEQVPRLTARMRGSGDEVAQTVLRQLERIDDATFARGLVFGDYDNIPWALAAVERWVQHVHARSLAARAQALTTSRLMTDRVDSWCPFAADHRPEPRDLFAPCLQRTQAVMLALAKGEREAWILRYAKDDMPALSLAPVTEATLVEQQALNFSRASALWTLFDATGEEALRKNYVDHIERQMAMFEHDPVPIDQNVAAFALHAISQSAHRFSARKRASAVLLAEPEWH